MAIFMTGRMAAADKLVALRKAGCAVRAVLGMGGAAEVVAKAAGL